MFCAVGAFAQSSAFGQAAQGIATEAVAIAKWLGIICLISCGVSAMVSAHHIFDKLVGVFIGLIFALFSTQIVGWIQSL